MGESVMQRVRRSLSRNEVEALREQLAELVPQTRADLPQVIRLMRLITRKSQAEYARLCGVAPRVLADIEAGKGAARVETLEKLVRPFGYEIGVVERETVTSYRRPTRQPVSRAELNRILTREIREAEGYADARISVQFIYPQPDETGCNWSPDVMLSPGKGGLTRELGVAVGRIVREARERYTVKD